MSHPARHRGFTTTELIFGLFNLALIGLAVGALLVAGSRGWESSDDMRQQLNDTRTTMLRLSAWGRQARRVVAINESGGNRFVDVILWTDDTYFPGEVNLSELKLLRYDALLQTLTLLAADMTEDQQRNPYLNRAYSPGLLSHPLFPLFMNLSRYVHQYPFAEHVTSFQAYADPGPPAFRALELQIRFELPGGEPCLQVISVSCRAPETSIQFPGADGRGGA